MRTELITIDHITTVCLPGQGAATCRYLTLDVGGFACDKHSGIGRLLDQKVAEGTIIARGDNCPGRSGHTKGAFTKENPT